MGDTDEDMDTTEIEEDWIEYVRGTRDRQRRKDEDSQYPLLDYDTQKDEM